ncbi:MAG: FAD-dependent monooxygenase [Xanthomonadales bacterium]|nr:FAD-dependent monooxygenase [Xanthomonadales bacterium]MBP6078637.1 FAD-dependent monooxygenase [Xanthomonadales bacterium]MBP7623273.1 FAD-dependent monooxygenase [Xanthomonadales bacterium]
MKPLDIAIIGYGTAGQAASLYLQRQGHRIHQVEQAPELRPVGAGFLLQPTGLSVLDELGLGEVARLCGARIDRLHGENERGRTIMDMRYADLDPRSNGLGMQRGALFEVLRSADALAGSVQTGVHVASVDAECGTYCTDDGRSHGPFDLVIVANGAHSALRQALAEHVLRDALYPWGAIWCLADDLHHRFHHDLEQRYRRAREMCGVLPVGTLPGQAPAARKLSVYWSVRTTDLDAVLAGGIAPVHDAIGRLWPDAERLMRAMTDLSAWRRASYRDVVLAKPHRGRVVLIGDAAHGMSPQLGQGANMALLDAQALSQALERGTTIASALDDYARTRAAHLAIYQFLSRWLTPLFQSDLDALAWWRDLLFLPLSRMPIARGESLKILTGLKRGWFGRLPL